MSRFTLERDGVVEAEGFEFSDGSVSIRWRTGLTPTTCTHGGGFKTVLQHHSNHTIVSDDDDMDGGGP